MSRVSAEISVATAAANGKAKSIKHEPASASDNFSALIDSNASAAASNSERSQVALPEPQAPQRANSNDRNLRNDRASHSDKDHSPADDKTAPSSEATDRDPNAAADKAKSADADKPVSSDSKPASAIKEKTSSDDTKASDAEAAVASNAAPATVVTPAAAALAATLVVPDAGIAETATKATLGGSAEAAPEIGASEAIKAATSATIATGLSAAATGTSPKGATAPAVKAKAATADGAAASDDTQTAAASSTLIGDGKDLKTDAAKTPATPESETAAKTKATNAEAVAPTAARHDHHAASASVQPSIQTNDFAQPVLNTSQQLLQPNQSQLLPAAQVSVALANNEPVPLSGLAVDIALRAASGKSSFDIRLDPAELGRIDVRLDVDKHGQVTSHLTVEKPATLDMLRRDAPQLQRALEDAGLKTGDNGLQFSLRDQSSFSGRQDDGNSGRQSQCLIISDDDTSLAPIAGKSYGRMLAASRGVDISI